MAFVLLMAAVFVPAAVNAAKAPGEYEGHLWDFSRTVKKSSGAFTYYAYPSKNGQEAWIYKIEITKKKGRGSLSIPSKLDDKKVTRLGAKTPNGDSMCNIFAGWAEPYHNAGARSEKADGIKTLTIPNTVKIIQELTFSGMNSITEVKIPKSVKSIAGNAFYRCKNLEKAEIAAGLSSLDPSAFRDCPKLTQITAVPGNKTFRSEDGCIITKKKNELVFAVTDKAELRIPEGVEVIKSYALNNCTAPVVHIPASVRQIEANAFMNPYGFQNVNLMDITVDAANSTYARDGQCIYKKTDKSLSVAIADAKRELYISEQMEKLAEGCSIVNLFDDELGGRYMSDGSGSWEKIVFPKNLKTVEGRGFSDLNGRKTYFTGERPPQITNAKNTHAILPIFTHVYVPEASLQLYQQWYKSNRRSPDGWHTFQPGEQL